MHRDIDDAEAALIRWAEANARGQDSELGYPNKASGGFIASWIKDSEEMAAVADATDIEKINASIESLSVPHHHIIWKRHNIGYKVWNFGNEIELYGQAKEAFRIKHFCK